MSLVGLNFVLDDETVTYNEGVTPPTDSEINTEISDVIKNNILK